MAGNASKYSPDMPERAKGLALLGYTNAEIAAAFGINVSTLYDWKNKHPELSDAIKEGGEVIDVQVAQALYKRTQGYMVTEEKTEQSESGIKTTVAEKHIPADTTAMIFWLKNRQPKQWRDKQEVDHSSSDGSMSPSTKEMSDEELEEKLKGYGIVKP